MFGRGEPVDLQVRRLEADIVRVRFDQVANRLAWEDAIAVEGRALDMARGARAVQAAARHGALAADRDRG